MNTQLNNPLYQQFVELVSVASADVIEECIHPLSESLAYAQQEISKIQQYADNLGRQYIDIEKVVDKTTKSVLAQTVQPLLIEFNEVNTKLNSAANEIIDIQTVLCELKSHSLEIKDKNKVLNDIVFDVNKKIFDELVGPVQKEIAEVAPILKTGSAALIKFEREVGNLNNLLNESEKISKEIIYKLSEFKELINVSQNILQKKIEESIFEIQLEINSKVDALDLKLTSKLKEIELGQIGRTQMTDKNLGELKSKIENISKGLDYQQSYLEKKLKQQLYIVLGVLGVVLIVLIFVGLPLF
ncbi:hypothetical protein [Acinetobacter bereziniae]|uniref:hypothetical protein n=1 Tax=Acinetobacter bereziniae TaxID=106648 RepID=UPI0015DB0AF8|nr:hypothetical protein [Acinetobacter bereziniae]